MLQCKKTNNSLLTSHQKSSKGVEVHLMFIFNAIVMAKKYLVFLTLLADQENLQCKKKKSAQLVTEYIPIYTHMYINRIFF